MLQSVRIQNYRGLRDVTLTLGPLTALVGPNGSGKSSVLAALDPDAGLDPSKVGWRHDPLLEVRVDYRRPEGNTTRINHRREGEWPPLSYQFLRFDLTLMRKANVLSRRPRLDAAGAALANAFATLTRRQQADLATQLCVLVPTFSDVDLVPVAQGQHTLRFHDRWDTSAYYAPDEVSDGTMLVLAFLLIQYQQDVPDLLAIEEPERGLHPYLVGELVALLRRLSTGEFGGTPIQIVLATQSADLLDHLEPEEVRFLNRDASDGSVRAETVDTKTPGWDKAFDEYKKSLGSAWLAGSLGGVPG
ncbi:MAG: AAA family ATPase [Polyangiaceae bacterium]|nr:AAA family ATPase [Polyangiaceae bacterium]